MSVYKQIIQGEKYFLYEHLRQDAWKQHASSRGGRFLELSSKNIAIASCIAAPLLSAAFQCLLFPSSTTLLGSLATFASAPIIGPLMLGVIIVAALPYGIASYLRAEQIIEAKNAKNLEAFNNLIKDPRFDEVQSDLYEKDFTHIAPLRVGRLNPTVWKHALRPW